jgi:hypothetical protein
MSINNPTLRASIEGAEYMPGGWATGTGDRRDCIRVPHPLDCGAVQEAGDPPPCWGDWAPELIELRDQELIARLAPGRRILEGDLQDDGEYLVLEDLEDEDEDVP